MSNKTNQPIQLIVMRDDSLAEEYMPKEPTLIERSLSHVQARLSAFSKEVATQAKLALFDLRMGTHYRQVRNNLRREVRKEQVCRDTGIYSLLRQTGHRA